jgi:hypothetical protein
MNIKLITMLLLSAPCLSAMEEPSPSTAKAAQIVLAQVASQQTTPRKKTNYKPLYTVGTRSLALSLASDEVSVQNTSSTQQPEKQLTRLTYDEVVTRNKTKTNMPLILALERFYKNKDYMHAQFPCASSKDGRNFIYRFLQSNSDLEPGFDKKVDDLLDSLRKLASCLKRIDFPESHCTPHPNYGPVRPNYTIYFEFDDMPKPGEIKPEKPLKK